MPLPVYIKQALETSGHWSHLSERQPPCTFIHSLMYVYFYLFCLTNNQSTTKKKTTTVGNILLKERMLFSFHCNAVPSFDVLLVATVCNQDYYRMLLYPPVSPVPFVHRPASMYVFFFFNALYNQHLSLSLSFRSKTYFSNVQVWASNMTVNPESPQ